VIAPAAAKTAATGTARGLRTRFVHLQGTPFQAGSVQLGDGSRYVLTRPELDEPETPGAPGIHVADHARRCHLKSVAAEELLQAVIRHFKRKIPDKQL
jgi:hypothetical protein